MNIVEVHRDDEHWTPGPLWRLHTHGGHRYVIFVCPNGHITLIEENRLNHDGLVRPALSLCPKALRECSFRENVRLDGWTEAAE